ncbi:Threonine efflux protein [Pseudomonas sp. THAF187a]|uniref:LysE family translocator n=1 Tax=Pseudomonadaceae TaxID=135621 RepID=UPI001269349E|nr:MULTISPECIES: LysE family translocator [unclassified Pseudomonas]TNF14554.1 MAG: LysE family translocator [Pseudomonadales bacterium]HIQ41549.1 LysE family translocator [Pseudomonas oleovorans]QFT23222.1 Threonine efflux protein [Pseudomonas sp. THAF187a]QFT43409.1 Threonine efflux protein [Pseudomonas sp. THAF42]WFC63445.1 LysE family translocator [Pseudomonas sp. REST10]|tara:strand:+ start:999 stop:1616 length:618 start_codon:yes stop_codon:yes gene_type:complete
MSEWIVVITITLLACISPGPDFALVCRQSLMLSRRAGLFTAVGIGLGVLVHVAYTLLGLGLLLQQSAWLFTLCKFAGAGYLLYLGLRMLRSRPEEQQTNSPALAVDAFAALRMGFLGNALNPKTSLFIVSLFMGVVSPQTSLASQLGYGAFIAIAHVAWFALVALGLSAQAVRLRLLAMRQRIEQLFGTLLVGFALWLATTSQPR